MTLDQQTLRAGDVITVRLAKSESLSHGAEIVIYAPDSSVKEFDLEILSVERPPEPLKVGDKVIWNGYPRDILGLHGDYAWVSTFESEFGVTLHVSNLGRIP